MTAAAARKRPCPICRREAGTRVENKTWPFCCERCRLIDLGKWLAEDYRIPADPDEPGGDAERIGNDED